MTEILERAEEALHLERHLGYLSRHLAENRDMALIECDLALDRLIELGRYVIEPFTPRDDYKLTFDTSYTKQEIYKTRV